MQEQMSKLKMRKQYLRGERGHSTNEMSTSEQLRAAKHSDLRTN